MNPYVETLIARLLAREGGVKDIGDGAGVTRWGQTAEWLNNWHLPIPNTVEDAAANYRVWLGLTNLNIIAGINLELADSLADWAINSGEEIPFEHFQRLLVAAGAHIKVDGIIGLFTLHAYYAHPDDSALRANLLADRLEFLGAWMSTHPTLAARLGGGLVNRVAPFARALVK